MIRRCFDTIADRRVPLRRRERPFLEALETRFLPAVTFSLPVDYPAAAFATSQVVGDFNGDGPLDLAVANRGANCVSVLLGKGDGTFRPAVNYSVGSNPVNVNDGDFRGRGTLDLVVANRDSASVSVLLGNGDGTFQKAVNYATGSQPFAVAVGDFNGDGIPDLAVAALGAGNGTGSGLSVLLGNGDGTFQRAVTINAGLYPNWVAAGDFRGTGTLDLAVADLGQSNGSGSGVRIFWGNGDGTFVDKDLYTTGLQPASIAVADFRGTGMLDLAVTNDTRYGTVSVLLGKGDGTFQNAVNYPSGAGPLDVVAADLDHDGRLDLAVANTGISGGAPSVSVFLGRGDGTFQPPQDLAVNSFPASVAAADFNGDGLPDLAVTSYLDGKISIMMNTTPVVSKLLVTGFPSPTTAGTPGAFAVIAQNSDGTLATNYQGTVHFTSTDSQAVLPGDYTFQTADNGVHVFTATLQTAGSRTLTGTDTTDGSITGTQTGIVVTPAAADHFRVDAPGAVSSGVPFDGTVTALDPYGNVDTNYHHAVTFTTTDGDPGVVLPPDYLFTASDAGSHTFPGAFVLVTPGDQALTATDTATQIQGSTLVTVTSPNTIPGVLGVAGGTPLAFPATTGEPRVATAVNDDSPPASSIAGAGSSSDRRIQPMKPPAVVDRVVGDWDLFGTDQALQP